MEEKSKGRKKRRGGAGRGRGQIQGPEQTPAPPVGGIERLSIEEETSSTTPKQCADVVGNVVPGEKPFEARIILRPGTGTLGRPILLHANFYPIQLDEDLVVYHYDVSVSKKIVRTAEKKGKSASTAPKPDLTPVARLPRFLAAALLDKLFYDEKSTFVNRDGLAFDGQFNLISRYKLAGVDKDGREFSVNIFNAEKNINEDFILKIKWVADIQVDIRQIFDRNLIERKSLATLILDVVLKQPYFFDLKYYIPQQRRIFYYPDPIDSYPLGNGVYRFPGFFQSIRPVSGWKLMLNIDKANTSFVKAGKVLDLLNELSLGDERAWSHPIDPRNMHILKKKLENLVKGLKIVQRQRRVQRVSKCLGVTLQSAEQIEFDNPAGKGRISVAEYFRQQYKSKEFVSAIRFPHLPCLHIGSSNKKNYVPLEFCEVKEGQRYPKKLDAGQSSQMLRCATEPADARKHSIQEDMKFLKLDQDKYLKSFGINVSMEMVKFNGRVLDPPMIKFNNANEAPKLGSWNMRGRQVISGCRIRKYGILCTGAFQQKYMDNEIDNFCKQLCKTANGMGLKIETPEPAWFGFEMVADQMRTRLQQAKQKVGSSLDLVFVILDGQNTDFYPCVKQAGDVMEGVNTQCIQLKNVKAARPDTIANVCLKINGKLGGVNSHLTNNSKASVKYFLNEPILFLGADVNHPSPSPGDGDDLVSCAAIVGNIDAHPSVYCARIFLQAQIVTNNGNNQVTRRPQEWISNMKDGAKMAMENFIKRNGVLPRRIIMYRDGVGETMFLLVLNRELKALREACTETAERFPDYVKKGGYKNNVYEPPITFIVVQKRHHTRLFCANKADAVGGPRANNVPPGTTVDVEIVHPEEFDFYLCSHLGIQGTSKPAHYHVLCDDSNFSADDLQTLTYHLCHTYCRATRSVSIPPPCYYADLVAYRARQYLSSRQTDASTVSSENAGQISIADLQRLVNVQDNIVNKGMYFV